MHLELQLLIDLCADCRMNQSIILTLEMSE
jgi:hypothetical protein